MPAEVEPICPTFMLNKCTHCDARGSGVCEAVPEDGLTRLSAAATALSFEPAQRFITEGDKAEHFFVINAGTAKLLKMLPDGRQQIVSFCGPGDFLGLSVFSLYSYGAEAVEPVRLCRFSRFTLRCLMTDFPAMERRLLKSATFELTLAQEQMLLLGRKNARERLASFLVARARATGACPQHGKPLSPPQVSLPMNRTDIGDFLGLRIETVSRTMTALKTDGIIEILPRCGVIIRDFDALESLAACI